MKFTFASKFIFLAFACSLFVSLFTIRLDASIVISGYTDAENDRFTNSGSFIMNGFDLSGIGQNASGGWGTAISRNVVISAAHAPSNGVLTFYESNDPDSTKVTRTVKAMSGMKIGSTDLYLAVLDSNLPETIAHYSFATEALAGTSGTDPLTVDDAGIYEGLNAYMFGLSPFDRTGIPNRPGQTNQAVGRNIVSGYSEDVPFLGNTDNDSIIFAQDADGDDDFVDFEARFETGDSGGPTFVGIGGELRLIGTNAFIYDATDFEIGGLGSGINYTGNQAAFINNFITINAVPEPNSTFLFAFGCALTAIRRRRARH